MAEVDYRPGRPTDEKLDNTLVVHMFSAILSEIRPSRTYVDFSCFCALKLCQGEPRWRRVQGAFGGAGRSNGRF
jgi:hypothetical protein